MNEGRPVQNRPPLITYNYRLTTYDVLLTAAASRAGCT
jgi:predicted nucleic acid-binding protein